MPPALRVALRLVAAVRWLKKQPWVDPENAQAFIDSLVAAGKPFEMLSCPMRKHGITDQAATLHLYRAMLDFWKRNL